MSWPEAIFGSVAVIGFVAFIYVLVRYRDRD